MSATFASLQFRNYRLWFLGALVSNVGTWMQRLGQDWLILTRLTENSSLAVGIGTALQFGPSFLLSPLAGVVADRFNKRTVLIITQTLSALLTAALGVLTVTDVVQLWHVYVMAALLGVVTAFDSPARLSFVSEMVPVSNVPNAVGLNSTAFNGARLVGPGLAGLLIAAIGTGWLFIINGVSYLAPILALVAMRSADLFQLPPAPKAKGMLREGLRYLRGRSDIMMTLIIIGVVSTFGMNFGMTTALMSRVEFGKGPGEYGLVGSVFAIGSLTGALLAARRERPRIRLVVGAAFAFGVATGLMALMPTYELFTLACIPAGFAALTLLTAANTTIQLSTDPAIRGRVLALYMMVLLGATPIGSPFVGWVGEQFGPRWALGVGSLTALLIAGLATVWAVRNWDLQIQYRFREHPRLQILNPRDFVDEQTAKSKATAAGHHTTQA